MKVVDGVLCIVWKPSKKGSAQVSAPVSLELAREIAGLDHEAKTFPVREDGKAFASCGLDDRVRKWVKKAGLVDDEGHATRSQHAIRKASAMELAEIAASQYGIMALMGHLQAKTSERYTTPVSRKKLSTAGIARLPNRPMTFLSAVVEQEPEIVVHNTSEVPDLIGSPEGRGRPGGRQRCARSQGLSLSNPPRITL